MFRYFIELQYNGKNFHGWQIQPNALTVQEIIEKALNIFIGSPTAATGCGRTDAGVHAKYFVAHFDSENKIEDLKNLAYKLNRYLSDEIRIIDIYQVKTDAHARFDALSRTYKYYITTAKNPFGIETEWHQYGKFNIDLMNKACKILFEYKDFTSFSKLHTQTKTNNCKIIEANWTQEGEKLIFTITADRFLRDMVRAITGTMMLVGRETISLNDFRNIIEVKNRQAAGQSVPAHALFLEDVEYPEDIRVF